MKKTMAAAIGTFGLPLGLFVAMFVQTASAAAPRLTGFGPLPVSALALTATQMLSSAPKINIFEYLLLFIMCPLLEDFQI